MTCYEYLWIMINLPRYVGSTAASLRRFGDSAAIRQQATMLLTKPGTTADTTLSAMCNRPEFCILAENWGYHGRTGRCHIRIPQYPSISINIPHLLDPSGTSACYTCKTATYLQPWLDVCLTICSKACCGAQEVRSGCQRGLRWPSGLGG